MDLRVLSKVCLELTDFVGGLADFLFKVDDEAESTEVTELESEK